MFGANAFGGPYFGQASADSGYVDSTTIPIVITPSSVELEESNDSAEIYIDIQPSGVDEYDASGTDTVDSDTVYVDISVLPTEVFESVEVDTVYVDISAISAELEQSVDAATVYVDLDASGIDVFAPLVPWWDPLPTGIRKWFEITPRKWETQTATRFRVTVRGRI